VEPTAVLALGDVQYEAGELANFQQDYDRSWGAFKAKTSPVIGNHECLGGDGAAGYFDYFGAAAGPRGLGYHSSRSAPGMSSPSTPPARWCPTAAAGTGRRNGRG
jgi:hypothetical protein